MVYECHMNDYIEWEKKVPKYHWRLKADNSKDPLYLVGFFVEYKLMPLSKIKRLGYNYEYSLDYVTQTLRDSQQKLEDFIQEEITEDTKSALL